MDGRPRCPCGRQDHGHHPHRRCRTQRPLARHRQAQPCAALQLRRHRPRAGRRPLRSDHQAGARRQHRPAQRPHDQPRHPQPAPGDLRSAADRCRPQPEDARLSQHHLHRRQRRESGRTARRCREAQREVRGRGHRGACAGVLRLQLRDPLHGLPGAGGRRRRRPPRRPDHHLEHAPRRPILGALRGAGRGGQGDHQRFLDRGPGSVAGAGPRDRGVPCRAYGSGDPHRDSEPRHAAGARPVRPVRGQAASGRWPAATSGRWSASRPGSPLDGRRQLQRQHLQLRGHPQPVADGQHRLDRER